jgi:hypothetical protein
MTDQQQLESIRKHLIEDALPSNVLTVAKVRVKRHLFCFGWKEGYGWGKQGEFTSVSQCIFAVYLGRDISNPDKESDKLVTKGTLSHHLGRKLNEAIFRLDGRDGTEEDIATLSKVTDILGLELRIEREP